MKKLYITSFLFFFGNLVMAQAVFQKLYFDSLFGGISTEVQVTDDGGYIIAGNIYDSVSGNNMILLKTDPDGIIQWKKSYGGNNDEWGYSVKQTADGGYIICGTRRNLTSSLTKAYVIKTNSNGDTLWTKTYSEPQADYYAKHIIQTYDMGYIFSVYRFDGTNDNYLLIKTDSTGNVLWNSSLSGAYYDDNGQIYQTPDSGLVLLQGKDATYITKISSGGTTQWGKKIYDWNNNCALNAISTTGDGGYILAGYYGPNGGAVNFCLVKTDSVGNAFWSKLYILGLTYGHGGIANSVQQTADGSYIAAGERYDSTWTNFAAVLKTDANGNLIWMKQYSNQMSYFSQVEQTPDNGFIMSGGNYIYLVKTDSAGNSGCNDSILNPSIGVPSITIVSNTSQQNYTIVTGSPLTMVQSPVIQEVTLCSSSVNIESNSFNKKNELNIFPNPFTDKLNITINTTTAAEIILYDIASRKLLRQKFISSTSINTEQLSKGLYLYEVRSKDGSCKKGKVVKD